MPRQVEQNVLPDNINLTTVDLPEFLRLQYDVLLKQKEEGRNDKT